MRIAYPKHRIALFVLLFLWGNPGRAYDSEWPPQVDPSGHPDLKFGELDIDVQGPLGEWLRHNHAGGRTAAVAFGDVDGVNDGDLCVVVYIANEVLAAFRLDLNWSGGKPTGKAEPLWAMFTDFARNNPSFGITNANGLNPPPNPPAHNGQGSSFVVPWDFVDADNQNEIVIYIDDGTTKQVMMLRQRSPGDPALADRSQWHFPEAPTPKILATIDQNAPGSFKLTDRATLIRAHDTYVNGVAYPRDLLFNDHNGRDHSVLSFGKTPQGSYEIKPTFYFFRNAPWPPNGTVTHEYNVFDINGDGIEEVMVDGVVELYYGMNAASQLVPKTRQLWRTGATGASDDHADTMHALDLDMDPSNGFEIIATPSVSWTPLHPLPAGVGPKLAERPIVWNTDGTFRDLNLDGHFGHGQLAFIGNWTATRQGFETIFFPKDTNVNPVGAASNPSIPALASSFAIDASTEELVVDGYDHCAPLAPLPQGLSNMQWSAGGPIWRALQLDWDGDRSSDEILSHGNHMVYVFRMGEKGDWGTQPPAGMPSQTEAQSGWSSPNGQCHWHWYKNLQESFPSGQAHSTWEHGGAGMFTHYYEKLAETAPDGMNWWPTTSIKAQDMGGDHREEILVTRFKSPLFTILYNPDPLNVPVQASPRGSIDYLRNRLTEDTLRVPLNYQQLTTNSPIGGGADAGVGDSSTGDSSTGDSSTGDSSTGDSSTGDSSTSDSSTSGSVDAGGGSADGDSTTGNSTEDLSGGCTVGAAGDVPWPLLILLWGYRRRR